MIEQVFEFGNNAIELASRILGPWIIRRRGDAEAQAELQQALVFQISHHIDSFPGDPDVVEAILSSGGRTNLINLAKILQKALPQLADEADPSRISDDWAANLKDKARTCSNEEMAQLWAQLLAGEANNPGSYSRKTVNTMADMDPDDALLFRSLCDFRLIPVNPIVDANGVSGFTRASAKSKLAVLDDKHEIYTERKVSFDSLARLDWLGLIRYVSVGYEVNHGNDKFAAYENGNQRLYLAQNGPIRFGNAEFTPAGTELSELCLPIDSAEGFMEYLTDAWRSENVRVARSIEEVASMSTQTGG